MRISVIIPALNEAGRIEQTLATIAAQPGPKEIIVVDGNSTDDTARLAERHATVISSPPGRARQMNRGARAASGTVLFFLHADTRVPADAFTAIRKTLADPTAEAGTFRLAFDIETPLLRFYSLCTRLPVPRICFGDRGLFVRRTVYDAIGGFPDLPLFEDLEMVRLLHERGGFRFLPDEVVTAARRFERYGPLRQQLRNTYLWLRYVFGTAPSRLAPLYPYDAP